MIRCCLLLLTVFASSMCLANTQSSMQDQLAPELVLANLNNTAEIDLEHYKGKVVYVDFWASSCFACRLSFPFLNKLQAKYAQQGFEIVAVNTDASKQDALDFLAKYPLNYPVAWDPEGTSADAYQVRALPTGFLIDASGKVRLVHLGFSVRHEAYLTAHVEKLLAEMIE
ncbi:MULTISPECIES: TlpA family protein disulfide reductase [Alteromonadaceae]|uniref:TlpA family protein disulfide reductase n=1 Tax=Alteromonadaceae TaxID=72275 RepID=UPI001C09C85F|nr:MULTISPECIES: TlpA disulfide reductase family protein [Aliiglaciecola]MBU2878918.1 TlpA family protein disulfide reductase [Aliiglaciecola lipolytica]MDO6712935.1 TlpA disulfide reductase family protein [Aliiglaciecola sp. 2_MG-2023]MDO6753974.1 TlpA disulfide reductase family protein [Aliiglaciecola sp. 1_MG-2023]